MLALTAGSSLAEHENPGEATIQVLHGRVRLTAGEVTWEGRSGDLLVVPDTRHALKAIEGSAVLLTVSKRTLNGGTALSPPPFAVPTRRPACNRHLPRAG